MKSNSLIGLAAALCVSIAAPAGAHGFSHASGSEQSFALIGDVPYGVAIEAKFDRVIDSINAAPRVRLVVHTGDVKAGSERCDDDLLQKRYNQFQTLKDAVIVTPGDNDWTDCHRANNGGYVPTERLAKFREIYYPVPGLSGGQHRMPVRTQARMAGFDDYVENMMWSFNGAMMATVHVVGSNNGLEPWSAIDPTDSYSSPRPDRVAEVAAREAAALAWIDEVFAQAHARRSAGVMIAMQANMNLDLPAAEQQRQGFNAVIERITQHAIAFGKPVLVAHGDSHYFRLDKPYTAPILPSGKGMVENITRVENFGAQDAHWVEVFVNPRDANVFRIEPRIVRANLFAR
ncbi:MAG: hypothetical protein B7X87_14300 [Hydrogenophilales bacterium 17-64-34]|nr:MAG: hypothetical protein B7X87_14300 [Hydrogenophilales bacterium 17-64-34]